MIAHFIGGPWHGEDRELTRAENFVRGVESPGPAPWNAPASSLLAQMTVPFEEFTYRRMGFGALSAGFTLYEYVEPTAEVEIVIRKRVPKSKVESTRAELVRTLGLPDGGRLHYSGPARD